MWISVAEKTPASKTVVIVGQSNAGRYRNFAGWLDDGAWRCFYPQHPNEIVVMHDATQDSGFVADIGDLRVEDFWMPVPQHSPKDGIVRGGYPA